MSSRQYYTVANATQQDTTSCTLVTALELKFTPDANKKYLLLGSALVRSSTTAAVTAVISQFTVDDGTALAIMYHFYRPRLSTAWQPVLCAAVYTGGSSPTEIAFQMRWQAYNNMSSVKNIQLIAIRLEDNDTFSQNTSTSGQTTTSTSWQDAQTLTFTPPSSGDYLIIATAHSNTSSASYRTDICLDVGGVEMCVGQQRPFDVWNMPTWRALHKVTLSAASTIKIKYKSSNALNTAMIRCTSIIALRLSDFPAFDYASSDARSTTTSTSLQTKVSLDSLTLASKYWLALFSAQVDVSSTLYNRETSGGLGTTSFMLEVARQDNTYANGDIPSYGLALWTTASNTDKLNIRYRSSSTSGTAGIANARIVALLLDVPFIPSAMIF